ncbi:MAG: lasso peptide biosynthesis B2 protein [Acidimicrobiales bacterium]
MKTTSPLPQAETISSRRARLRLAAVASWRWRGDLLTAVMLLPPTALRLRREGYASTVAWIDDRIRRAGSATSSAENAAPTARELGFVVRLTARLVPDATCLRRALVLRYLLGRRGIPSVIRLGVRPGTAGEDLAFHAWVEVQDEVVSEQPKLIAGYEVLVDEPNGEGW